MTRIGLLGGSFDPVHRAHLALAHAATQALALDELRWVPAGQPWQKTGQRAVTPAAHRLAMLEIALAEEAGTPDAAAWVLDRCELERDGPSYTLDTVRALQAARPGAEVFLVIGRDQHARLHTWHGWPELLQRARLAVAGRPDAEPAAPDAAVHPEVSAHGFVPVPLPPLAVSSTEIRRRAAAGLDLSQLVPPGVARYIAHHRLYATPAAA